MIGNMETADALPRAQRNVLSGGFGLPSPAAGAVADRQRPPGGSDRRQRLSIPVLFDNVIGAAGASVP
jgi:hypothetical protein